MIHPQRDQALYLINGVFFHSAEELGLGEENVPAHPALQEANALYPFMYSGFLGRDETCVMEGVLTGATLDEFGIAELLDVTLNLDEGTLEFTKSYVGKPGPIFYRLRKQGFGLWVGSYNGEGIKTGFTRCVLTPISPEFFLPPPSLW